MNIPDDLNYTRDHEWVRIDGVRATIGVTGHAAEQLGDIVYTELPSEGEEVTKGETFGVIESVKAVSDCYAPLSGKVAEVNDALAENPESINEDPYGEGWMITIEMSDGAEAKGLMDGKAYRTFLAEEKA